MPQKEDRTPATLRAFAVLEALAAADQPATLARLVESCKLPKPTVYRMLAMLEQAGLVWREPASRGYTPGPRLAALGRDVMLNGSLRAERHSILARLVEVIGETCNFTMLDGAEVVYLDRVEAAWPLRVTLSPGSHVPLHCTASGKLLLALLPKAAGTPPPGALARAASRRGEGEVAARAAAEGGETPAAGPSRSLPPYRHDHHRRQTARR